MTTDDVRFARMLAGAREGIRRNPTPDGALVYEALVLLRESLTISMGGVRISQASLGFTRVIWRRKRQ